MYVFDTREQHNSDSAPAFLAPAWARPGGVGDSKEEAATAQHCESLEGWRAVFGFLPVALRGRSVLLLLFRVDIWGYL
jgi:hypothetical protein